MSVGDALTNIVGRYFGKWKIPFNPKKHFEGTIVAIFASTFTAFFFVDFAPALLGSTAAMLVETLPLKIGKIEIDDNLVIPIVAGFVMTIL